MTHEILITGFGGQGILYMGKVLAYYGMMKEYHVSWLPSYGPEMRGGTAYCAVKISDKPIGSPLVVNPTVLVAMNKPSYVKFIDTVARGGIALIDETLIDLKTERTDIQPIYIPATQIAHDIGTPKLANMVMLGKLAKQIGIDHSDLAVAIEKSIGSKQNLIDANIKAISV